MKQALIFSDSHGRIKRALEIIKEYPKAEAIFHCGDICGDEEQLRRATPHPVCIVKGNCDYNNDLRDFIVTSFGGKKIAMCHGHRHILYGGELDALKYFGLEQGADIVLFGHTHKPLVEQNSAITVINPGSISRPRQSDLIPTYAVLEIDDQGEIHVEIKRVR